MEILIYGGTFNPLHYGHINNIQVACRTFKFDKIIVVPDKIGHFKNEEDLAPWQDRLNMIDMGLATLKNCPCPIEIDEIELDNKKIKYSIDVVEHIQSEYPDAKLYFLIGSDQVAKLNYWRESERLKNLVTFIVSKRTKDFVSEEFYVLNNKVYDVSSSSVRERYTTTLIKEVDDYIRGKGLYLEQVITHYMSKKRVTHSINVARMAKKYAEKYHIDGCKAYIAGMLHDLAKELPLKKQYALVKNPKKTFELNDNTAHSYAATSLIKKDLKINDPDILSAVAKHTAAAFEMSPLDKLIYVCDTLSEERDFKGVKHLRKVLDQDLNQAFKECFLASMASLRARKITIDKKLSELEEQIRSEV